MPWRFRPTPALFVSLLCAGAFMVMVLVLSNKKVRGADHDITAMLQDNATSLLRSIMILFNWFGSEAAFLLLSFMVWLILYPLVQYWKERLFLAGVIIGSLVFNLILKMGFHRPRPPGPYLVYAEGYSFPSGHAMSSVCLYGLLAYFLWRRIRSGIGRLLVVLLLGMVVAATGISGIVLQIHYVSDVVGGFVIGASWLAGCIWVYQCRPRYRMKGKITPRLR
ncbi:phosphatase PAP2 family protein [Paenibacillus cremeus]|uniref:Phosphatase PAP2 family protein n=1 Tax=Paenibacillus cremeus TaxID=2163881 RepID=A0A559KFJ8_9BACL|nr:phosphatase PAP2 family protein [Paenibacillus cremeus]TVY10900.1 phosphatase PAP2 family protein [Paenibacillus cremeus]